MRWNIKSDVKITQENFLTTLLANRGGDENFLKKYTIQDLPDPFLIYDMQKCVDRIEKAIANNEKIYIHGDFDVDGTAATAIIWGYLYRVRKADVMPYIPHRIDEGYGLSKKTLDKIIDDGGQLIITVDCGVKDIELTEYVKSRGAEIIISDHHEFVHDEKENPVLPDTTVIHGMHPESKNPIVVCGGVTAWMIICALEKNETGEAFTNNTLHFLDLAAITTLSDVMPLNGINRIIVSLGLEFMRGNLKFQNSEISLGIKSLCEIANINRENLDAYHIGFVLGPRLNAPGRIENSAMNSLRLLCTSSKSQATELAHHLDDLNKKRQEITEMYIKKVEEQIFLKGENIPKLIFAHGEDWPEGIIGLVAGKIAEKYYRPTFIMSYNTKEKKVTGSSRSIKNFHLVKALDECKDYLDRYGGHYMAAGFSLKKENIEKFHDKLMQVVESILSDEDIIPQLNIDFVIDASVMNEKSITQIKNLAPFGYGNITPVFAIENATLLEKKFMGTTGQHVKYIFKVNDKVVEGVVFNVKDEWKNLDQNKPYDIAINLDENEWNGRKTVQMMIKDMRES